MFLNSIRLLENYLKTRRILICVIAVFILSKLFFLNYPFFWDESWSYETAIRVMYRDGPTLIPHAINSIYFRGHPLFFFAVVATWMKIFGTSHVSQHVFSLVISTLVLISIYEISNKVFNKRVALFCIFLIPVQVMFFVQSTMMLPEILIGLLALLTLYFYATARHLYVFLCLSTFLLTKESGIAMGIVLGIHSTAALFSKKHTLKDKLKRFFSIFFPGVVLLFFYLLQKKINGWFLFPEHVNLLKFNWQSFWDGFKFTQKILFYTDLRFRLFQLLLLLSVVVSIYRKKILYAIPIIPAFFIFLLVEDKVDWHSGQFLFPLTLLSFMVTIYALLKLLPYKTNLTARFSYLSISFIIVYLVFSSFNFITNRYLESILILVILFAAVFFDLLLTCLNNTVLLLTCVTAGLISYYGFKENTSWGDCDLGAFPAMKVQQGVVNYLEQNNLYDKNILLSNYQQYEHLTNPYSGFLSGNRTFTKASFDIPKSDYMIFDNVESCDMYHYIKSDTDLHLIYRVAAGDTWGEVYKTSNN